MSEWVVDKCLRNKKDVKHKNRMKNKQLVTSIFLLIEQLLYYVFDSQFFIAILFFGSESIRPSYPCVIKHHNPLNRHTDE